MTSALEGHIANEQDGSLSAIMMQEEVRQVPLRQNKLYLCKYVIESIVGAYVQIVLYDGVQSSMLPYIKLRTAIRDCIHYRKNK